MSRALPCKHIAHIRCMAKCENGFISFYRALIFPKGVISARFGIPIMGLYSDTHIYREALYAYNPAMCVACLTLCMCLVRLNIYHPNPSIVLWYIYISRSYTDRTTIQ